MFRKKGLIITIVLLFFVIIIATNLTKMGVIASGNNEKLVVKYEEARKKNISNTILISGVVRPASEQKVYLDSAKGSVDKVYVKVGDKVEEGDKLFLYNNKELTHQLEQAKIAKEKILVQLEQQNNNLKILKDKKSKIENEEGKKEIEAQINDIGYQIRINNLDYKQNEGIINNLQEEIHELHELSNINGIVKNVNSMTRSSAVEVPIVEIQKEGDFIISGALSEYEKYQLSEGQLVKVISKVEKGKFWKGKIESISDTPLSDLSISGNSEGDENISSYLYTVKLEDSTGLQNGYHVSLEVELNLKEGVIVIPNSSVIQNNEKQFVFVLTKENKLEKRLIETGIAQGKYIEVQKGLRENEKIIIRPTEDMESGMEVTY